MLSSPSRQSASSKSLRGGPVAAWGTWGRRSRPQVSCVLAEFPRSPSRRGCAGRTGGQERPTAGVSGACCLICSGTSRTIPQGTVLRRSCARVCGLEADRGQIGPVGLYFNPTLLGRSPPRPPPTSAGLLRTASKSTWTPSLPNRRWSSSPGSGSRKPACGSTSSGGTRSSLGLCLASGETAGSCALSIP